MRRHQVGTAVLAAATVLLAAATSGPAAHRAGSQPGPNAVRPATGLVAVAARYSFDDLAPNELAALARTAAAAPVAAALRPPVRPPSTGAVGSLPAAGTPQAVLADAYRKAVAASPRSCHLRPEHLAAIGQVESGSIGGRSVTSGHRVTPEIYGPLLDGGPFAVVRDSDGGSYDGDSQYDRAMGPLQFLPGTWRWAGRDGDGDGRRDPQNLYDAALATAGYLCLGGRDLSRTADLRSAVLSYNQSDDYHAAVVEWVSYFRQHGLAALTSVAFRVGSGGRASDLPDAEPDPTPATAAPTKAPTAGAPAKKPVRSGPATATPAPTTTTRPPTPTSPPPTTAPVPSDPSPAPSTPAPTVPEPPPSSTPADPDPSAAG